MTSIIRHLDRADVPAHLRQGYEGRRFTAQLAESVTIPASAGLWDGGSKEYFYALQLATGATVQACAPDPFDGTQRDRRIAIPAGVAIVRHSVFQGKDTGLTFFIRPEDAAGLLPPPAAELDPTHRAVLKITRECMSAYRKDEARRQGITPAQWEAAKADLIKAGLLAASGAITTAGKNAIG